MTSEPNSHDELTTLSDEFWSGYLAHFDRVDRPEFARWSGYFADPGHQTQFMVVPSYYVHRKP